MVSKEQKHRKIAIFCHNKILQAESENKTLVLNYNKTKCVPYTWDEHKDLFYCGSAQGKEYHGFIVDISEVGRIYDDLIKSGLFIEKKPRYEIGKNHQRNYNPPWTPTVYLNLRKWSDYLFKMNDTTMDTIAEDFLKSRARDEDRHDIDCLLANIIHDSKSIISNLPTLGFSSLGMLESFHKILLNLDKEIVSRYFELSGVNLNGGLLGSDVEPVLIEPSPLNGSIEPLYDLSLSEKDTDRLCCSESPVSPLTQYCIDWASSHGVTIETPRSKIYETPHGQFKIRDDGIHIEFTDGFQG